MRCSVDDGMSDACAVVVAAEHAVVHGRAVLLAAGERFAGTTADARTMERGCLVHMPVQEVAHCVGSRVPWRYTETGRFFSLPGTAILPVSGLRNAFGPLQALTPTGAPASATVVGGRGPARMRWALRFRGEEYRGYYGCPDTRSSLGTACVKGDVPLSEGSGPRGGGAQSPERPHRGSYPEETVRRRRTGGAREAHRRCAGGARMRSIRGTMGAQILGAPLAQHGSREARPYRRGQGCAGGAQRCTGGAQVVHRRCTEVHRRCTGGAQRCTGGAQVVRRRCTEVHRRGTGGAQRRAGDAQEAHMWCTGGAQG